MEGDTFQKEVLQKGDGPGVQKGQFVTVAADLYLEEGHKGIWSTHQTSRFLFSATKQPEPFEFQAKQGGVIKGWDDGVGTMRLGERARLTIPWEHGYGAAGKSSFQIPGKANLVFEIEVLKLGNTGSK